MTNEIMNPTTERSLLGLMMNNQETAIEVITEFEVKDKEFLVQTNRNIFNAVCYLHNKDTIPTPPVIYDIITSKKAKQELDDMGGIEYIEDISAIEVDSSNAKILSDKLKQTYTRDRIHKYAKDIADSMLTEATEVLNQEELISVMENKVNDLNAEVAVQEVVRKFGEGLKERLQARAENPAEVAGLSTGYPTFDKLTNGLQGGDLVVICARAKMGKSAMAMNIIKNICIMQKIPGVYIDTEMTTEEQEDRLVANIANVPHSEILNGSFVLDTEAGKANDKMKRIDNAIELIQEAPYYHYYMPDFTAEKIERVLKKHKYKDDIQIAIFDYIKMDNGSNLNMAKEYQWLGVLASRIKAMAGKLNIPIIAPAQENRDDDGGTEKGAKNVGGSDRILQLATKLMFLMEKPEEKINEEGVDKGNRWLKITHQRNGASKLPPINFQFDNEYLNMREVQ